MQWMANDVPRVQLERIFLGGSFRQDNGRIQRAQPAGRSMGNKMDVGELLGRTIQIRRSGRLSACVNLSALRGEMLFDVRDLNRSFRQFAIFGISNNGVADKQKLSRLDPR